MKKNMGIQINDLHAFALPKIEEIQLVHNVHFTQEGSKILADEVIKAIRVSLAKPKSAPQTK